MSCPHKHPDPGPSRQPGKRYWRSLEEFAQTREFQEQIGREFPNRASELKDDVSRRRFLALMGGSLALAGIMTGGGCVRKREEIEPYVVPPEQVVPGKPLFFATAMPLPGGCGIGLLAESHEGRPTKVEGNPDHPGSLGSTDLFSQASILSLYDPDRARTISSGGQVRTWAQFISALEPALNQVRSSRGKGLHILTETITSPSLAGQLRQIMAMLPEAKWHQWEPLNNDNALQASQAAFGKHVDVVYHLDRADRIVSLDADFLMQGPAAVRYGRDFAKKRKVQGKNSASNRVYALCSTPTSTYALADHRLSLPASQILPLAYELFGALNELATGRKSATNPHPFVQTASADLWANRGKSLVIPGQHQPAAVHVLAHAINELLESAGQTLSYISTVEAEPTNQLASLTELNQSLRSQNVSLLLILGANPAYTAPAELEFASALKDSHALKIHQSLLVDETSECCDWHIPETHYLEAWGDVRAFDGTVSVIQPLIYPLFQAWTPSQLLAAISGNFMADPREIVREHWRSAHSGKDFEHFWLSTLQKGVVQNTAFPELSVRFNPSATPPAPESDTSNAIELQFRADPTIHDGRFANNGWLQELPKPISRLVWDNAALISPATAKQFSLSDNDVVELSLENRSISVPVLLLPGQPDRAITLHVGYGRKLQRGTAANGAGFNAYLLRTSEHLHHAAHLRMKPTGDTYSLVRTQTHFMIEHREEEVLHIQTLADYLKPATTSGDPAELDKPRKYNLSLYPEWNYTDRYPHQHRWGMSIDMNACTGCSACVIACVAENNSPIVGKDQVSRGREMHWLRIDSYYTDQPEFPGGPYFQPMLCQQCEKAPCEIVCPVGATTHSSEGINEMTYNRCVGTRYCSNNCPYKVRRFNFLQYADITPLAEMHYNPDVTVRQRGVMEKCTFCIQRLNQTRVDIKQMEADVLRASTDEEKLTLRKQMDERMSGLQTACQQACPTQAIVFGDMNWKYADSTQSPVIADKQLPHAYSVLTELQTQPRVTYLPRLLNPSRGGGV